MQNVIIKKIIKYDKISWLKYINKFLPFLFSKFKNGNTFWHYACFYQSIPLLEYALLSKSGIDDFNDRGLSPIHSLIESAFFIKVNNTIDFMIDEKFLEAFLQHRPNINIPWARKFPVETNSKNDISGTPLEILIMLFWKHILNRKRIDYMNYYQNYENVFLRLCKYGANVNFLYEGEDFGKNDTLQDAMQKQKNRIVSHYFVRFLFVTKDIYAVYPFFKNKTTDFNILDEQNNNLLHILFGKLENRYDKIDIQLGEKLIIEIFENPNFNSKTILDKNIFSRQAINSFTKNQNNYKSLINSYLVKNSLNQKLKDKPEVKIKILKI